MSSGPKSYKWIAIADSTTVYPSAMCTGTGPGPDIDEARKQGADFLEALTEKGSTLAEEWMERTRPRRRRSRLGRVLVVLAVLGAAVALVSRTK